VLGAAPAALAKHLARAYDGSMGLTLQLRGGLLAYFGDASRPRAKWLSLARVLADPSSAGASYIDVRLPERPAAGFAAGTMPPANAAAGASATSGEEALSGEGATSGAGAAAGGEQSSAGGEASSGEHASSSERSPSGERASGEASPTGSEAASSPAGEAAGPHG